MHEWFGPPASSIPPLLLLAWLAEQALVGAPANARVLWIGRAVWPYPPALAGPFGVRGSEAGRRNRWSLALERTDGRDPRLLRASAFLDPRGLGGRLWTIDAALRCATVAAVVADGSGLDMAATRRLQLAAEAGSALALVARPPGDERQLSAAGVRWRVEAVPEGALPAWRLELLRKKGARP